MDSTGLTVIFLILAEIDNEGVIEPDTDAPQEMGDENVEVSSVAYFLLVVRNVKVPPIAVILWHNSGRAHTKSFSDLRYLGKHFILLLKIFVKISIIFNHTLTISEIFIFCLPAFSVCICFDYSLDYRVHLTFIFRSEIAY